ncbi:hypothetical protein VPH35_138554 [Triticum aestivum]|uniref:Uncharacterized protein n=1 Tax=Aegilops tauschii subsp. strangulata TaxID=200361 RepID=A0A453SFG8_AEGTS
MLSATSRSNHSLALVTRGLGGVTASYLQHGVTAPGALFNRLSHRHVLTAPVTRTANNHLNLPCPALPRGCCCDALSTGKKGPRVRPLYVRSIGLAGQDREASIRRPARTPDELTDTRI